MERTHLLATLLAAYPITPTSELAKEYRTSPRAIQCLCNSYGVHKTKEERQRICIMNGRDVFVRLIHARRKNKRNYERREREKDEFTTIAK